jgi:hypothetical protein
LEDLERVMAAPRTNGAPLALVPPLVTARGGKGGVVYRSDSAHIQCWTGLDIPVEINAQGLLTAYDSWSAVQTRGLPRLSDLIATDAAKADNDMLLLLKLSNDYIAVAQGADYIRRIGRDLRGRLLSEFNARSAPCSRKSTTPASSRSRRSIVARPSISPAIASAGRACFCRCKRTTGEMRCW